MSRLTCTAVGAAILLAAVPASAGDPALAPRYPETRRDGTVEVQFGEAVADPYRWLEADVRQSPEVAEWVAAQNAVTNAYLADLPGREILARRIRSLLDFERFSIPKKGGKHYFYLRNSGLQNQSALYVRDGLQGTARLLIDPSSWARDGATALDQWQPSPSGRYLAYTVQDGGSDWRTIRVLDVASGKVLDDTLEWANDTELGWVGDEGVLYSRFPAPPPGQEFQALAFNKSVWFHRVGTPQSADELAYATPDHPEWSHKARVTADGRWAVLTTEIGTDPRFAINVIDLRKRGKLGWKPRELVGGFTNDWKLVDGLGSKLWFVTNDQAPRYRLVSIDLGRRNPAWSEVVPQGEAKLENGNIVGDRLIVSYLQDAASRAVIMDLNGKPGRTLVLNGIGTASGFDGRPGDPETFYQFSSFNQPSAVFRLDLRNGLATPFAFPKLAFDPADFAVEQRFYPSKDGTQVPMFIVRSRKLAESNAAAPTLLYGYGGFDISMTPGFSATRMAWLQSGGVFVLANIRGGGEYGKAWHEAGRLDKKQNTFDDFIAAGEYLIAQGITPKGGLAIQGGSNGGMLVGAVLNQRPDLFAAANPDVGVMDMLRFDRFTSGRYWVDDYGYPDREPDWRLLRGYSPYHNIRKAAYPAIIVTTADTDDRVIPGHSFKYAAALQAAEAGPRPHLIRIETRAGHGAGKPTDKVIATGADVLAFLAFWTGLKVTE
jgi:prolyl oligopeptidase